MTKITTSQIIAYAEMQQQRVKTSQIVAYAEITSKQLNVSQLLVVIEVTEPFAADPFGPKIQVI